VPENGVRSLREKWHGMIMRLLKGTHDHYMFFLPVRKGWGHWLLGRFFRGIAIDNEHLEMLRRLPADAVLVYTIQHKSYFEYLFYHACYPALKVPPPELGFGMSPWLLQPVSHFWRIVLARLHWLATRFQWLDPYANGYWQRQLLDGRAAILPLVQKRGFYRRFVKAKTDPMRFLIELQKSTDRPVYLIPHLMFFGKNPEPAVPRLRDFFLGTEQRPGLIRRMMILFRGTGKVFVEISQPLDLRRFIASSDRSETNPEYQALMLRRHLLMMHNRHRQSITGPVVKSQEELKESILSNQRMRQFMNHYSESRKQSLHEVRKQADSYIDEIAAKYDHLTISWAARGVEWLLRTMYDGIVLDTEGLQQVKNMSRKGPLLLVPCHKSHMDYIILSTVLYRHNIPAPHIAAGKNLSFWPMGPFFRSVGAFFIRRSFSGAVVYAKVFAEYLYKLLEEGFNIELFIEGGRSRSGKLLMPKLGLITLLFNAFKEKICEDMIFVPVFIGYDQVLEETAYLQEITGGQKKPETISQVLSARRYLKRRYGKIYINFHKPFSMRDFLQDNNANLDEISTKDQNALCRNLGWRIINAIDQASVVTPHALVASAALNSASIRFTAEELMQIVQTYLAFLNSQKAKLTDTLALDPTRACEQALENYVQRKFLELPAGERHLAAEMAQYMLPSNQRLQLEYYKNNCIAYFVPAAFTSTAILAKDAFQFSSVDLHDCYRYMQEFFKYEFAFDLNSVAERAVRKSIKSFIDDAILIPHPTLPDTYQITSVGFRKLKLFARFLLTYLESYWVVLHYYKQTPRSGASDKDRMKKIQSLGRSMLKRHELTLPESLSRINYENGISFFTSHGIKGAENTEQIEAYEQQMRGFMAMMRQ
jgi:glycerol-3-phosphate O-acyltransferase